MTILANLFKLSFGGKEISVQNPIASDGDSVYCKDIDKDRSSMYNFSGSICDSFDNLHTIVKDVTSDNPKILFVHFNRPVITYALGLGNAEGDNNPDAPNFSNVKIIALNSGDTETILVDESVNSIKYTSKTFQFSPLGMNGVRFEFHTTDGVGLTNIAIQKSILATARNLPTVLYAEQGIAGLLLNSGSPDMNVNGSITPVDFEFEATHFSFIERGFIALTDGPSEHTSSNFGAISALTNGVSVIVLSNGVELEIANWKTNIDIPLTMYDYNNPFKDGAYAGRWTFSKDNGEPYALRPGDKVVIRIQDDLSGIDLLQFKIKGHI